MPNYQGNTSLTDPELAAEIKASNVDILLVALGCPKQERWIHDNFANSNAKVAMGVGASLDFLSGSVQRAPGLCQRLKLEFLFRLCQEPKRLGLRYLKDFLYYRRILKQLTTANN